jgi:glycosyltransferase involved in cell wall biosynthesis
MIKVLFLTQNLGGGGAEKVLVNLVNSMDKSRFDITVKTIFGGGVNQERLTSNVKYTCCNKKIFPGISRIYSYLPAKALYKNIVGKEEYDIVVAYMHGIPTKVLVGAPEKMKKVAWLHTGNMSQMSLFRCFPSKKATVKAMKKYDAIVGVAQTVTDSFSAYTGIKEKLYTCYNTNELDKILQQSYETVALPQMKKPIICSVGRFTSEKGFSRLIDISFRLNQEGVSHSLMLIGDGVLREGLQKKVADMQYKDVYFTGFQKNPYAFMRQADMFVCSSYFEGLSTATTEAVVLGLPCVSTDVSGAREILTPDSQGLVVENTDEALYEGIKQMLGKIARGEIDKQKIQDSAERFSVKNTVGKVEELLLSIKEK